MSVRNTTKGRKSAPARKGKPLQRNLEQSADDSVRSGSTGSRAAGLDAKRGKSTPMTDLRQSGEGLQWHRSAMLAAVDRLLEKSVAGHPGESFSMRVPGRPEMLFVQSDRGLKARGSRIELISLMPDAAELLDAPDEFKARAIHISIYLNRPDTGAVFLGRQKWARILGDLGEAMPAVFDEQVRQLGPRVRRYESWNSRDLQKAMQQGSNAFLLPEGALILGMTLDKAIFNAELLEKCARAFVLARLTGRPFKKIPWYVRLIANQRLRKDEKRSAESYAAGKIPEGFTAY
ncbi:MAG: class II aldolase/adducin family protein [Leptospiraceae bacterium]|nr:class II aldolase/adducin family protein [Leptospiraceae bacterium]